MHLFRVSAWLRRHVVLANAPLGKRGNDGAVLLEESDETSVPAKSMLAMRCLRTSFVSLRCVDALLFGAGRSLTRKI